MKMILSPIILILFMTLAFLQGCRKDKTPCKGQTNYYNLSEPEKAKVSYTGKDTLIFVSNTNDTAVCIGTGKKQYYQTELIPNYTNNVCEPPSTNNYEAYEYTFISNHQKLEIELGLYVGRDVTAPSIYIWYNKMYEFILSVDNVGRPSAANFVGTKVIRDIVYIDVSVANQYYNPAFAKLYYNKHQGILKIQNADSTEVWELIKR